MSRRIVSIPEEKLRQIFIRQLALRTQVCVSSQNFLKEPVAPNLTYHVFYLYIKYIPTQTHLHFSQLHHANVYATILTFITQIFLPLGRKKLKARSPKFVCTTSHDGRNFHLYKNTL